MKQPKKIAILGSTGSIGTQALDVIERNPHLFSVSVLTAGSNDTLLIQQALKFKPSTVVIADHQRYAVVRDALSGENISVLSGEDRLSEVVALDEVNMVLTAMVGYAGLKPAIAAIQAGKQIALANKETLVVAGELITCWARDKQVEVLPVDSEHSAIFQCLAGENPSSVEKIILTASGGPFRTISAERMHSVTRHEALRHPNWTMGAKITIDSASLMNKGLEAIEARWLFNLHPGQIDVIIHPQSIIHSMVQFTDGSIKAQMGLPDMRLPIQYALAWPQRVSSDYPRFSFRDFSSLTFEEPDLKRFPNLAIAYDVMHRGGNSACVMNAANEIAVDAFLNERISFYGMTQVIEKTLGKATFLPHPGYDEYVQSDREARVLAQSFIS